MWVQREGRNIVAAFRREQPFATEKLADNDVELLAFLNPTPPSKEDAVETRINLDPVLLALLKRQAKVEGKTIREVLDEVRAEVTP